VVAAHPDDETIGAGAFLRLMHRPVLVHVTDGAPRDMRDAAANGFESRAAYAETRRRELLESLRAGGIDPAEAVSLGYVDQEASLHLAELARQLADLLRRLGVDSIFTHAYEGGHPDHDAAAFAVHAACRLMPAESRPRVVEYTSYHSRGGRMETGVFLPEGGRREVVMKLDGEGRARKERMVACYRTQRRVLQYFGCAEERFRPAPEYDFAAPPHAGPLFYEQFDLGMTAARWSELAQGAREDLRLP